MIATILQGGLGNQMFMYAMARAMAIRNRTEAVFNINWFKYDSYYKRNLELNFFNTFLLQNRRLTFDFFHSGKIYNFSKYWGFNFFAPSYKFIREESPYYFQRELINDSYKNVFLEGYWQSEKYFEDFKDVIKKDFTLKNDVGDNVKEELQHLLRGDRDLVFIGIRRYQECRTIPQWVLLGDDYYNRAIELMESKINSPRFVVFTQDQEWAKTHLHAKAPIVFASPKEGMMSSVEDMFLMTNCRHAIISNSSYYWWGAWLSKYNDGIVVAPDNFSNKDCVCDSWIKLKSNLV